MLVTGVVSKGHFAGGGLCWCRGEAVFIINNSLVQHLYDNVFCQTSNIGIQLKPGSEDQQQCSKCFVNNQSQVKYVATRTPREWSKDGVGN